MGKGKEITTPLSIVQYCGCIRGKGKLKEFLCWCFQNLEILRFFWVIKKERLFLFLTGVLPPPFFPVAPKENILGSKLVCAHVCPNDAFASVAAVLF